MKNIFVLKPILAGLLIGSFFQGCSPADEDIDPEIMDLISDIEYVCNLIPERYVYFEKKVSRWDEACEIAKDSALQTVDKVSRLAVLENLIWELYDPHLNLGVSGPSSPALVPTNSDIAVSIRDSLVKIHALRPESPARRYLKVGDIIKEIDGMPVEKAAKRRMKTGNTSDTERFHWAVTGELAGYQNKERLIKIQRNGKEIKFELEPHKPLVRPVLSALGHYNNNTCFIRPHNSLGQHGLVREVDIFLAEKNCSGGIIFDLRDTPSGGNTGVAEPLLGLFMDDTTPYQKLILEDGRVVDFFPKRTARHYEDIPLVVLVGPWTGSMGEGMAIGFDSAKRAPVLGGMMAKLGGALDVFTLPALGYTLRLPTRETLQVNGSSRNAFKSPLVREETIQIYVGEPSLRDALSEYLAQKY